MVMKKLTRKLRRDILKNIGQYLSIVIVMAIGMSFLTGMMTTSQALDDNVTRFYEETNLANYWVSFSSIDSDKIESINQNNSFLKCEGRYKQTGFLSGNPETEFVVTSFFDSDTINTPYLAKGQLPINENECLLIDTYAAANSLEVGNSINVLLNGKEYLLTISGTYLSPECVYFVKDMNSFIPDYENYGAILLAKEFYQKNVVTSFNEVVVSLSDAYTEAHSSDEIYQQITDIFSAEANFVYLVGRDNVLSVSMTQLEIDSIKRMSVVLPIAFYLVAGLLLFISIARMIESERTQIGIMKALGINRGYILLHYLMFAIVVAVIGSMIGGALGYPIQQYMYNMYGDFFTVPNYGFSFQGKILFLGLLFAVVFGSLAVLLAIRKYLTAIPSSLLRPLPPKTKNLRKVTGSKLSFKGKIILRNILNNKGRTLLASFGVMFSCGLIIAGLALGFTTTEIIDFEYDNVQNYDLQILYSYPLSIDQSNGLMNSNEFSSTNSTSMEALHLESDEKVSLTVLPKDQSEIRFYDNMKKSTQLGNGFTLTNKFASDNNLSVGDTIVFRIVIGEQVATVTGLVDQVVISYLSQGVYTTYEYLEGLGYSIPVTTCYVKVSDSSKMNSIKTSLSEFDQVSFVNSRQDIIDKINDSMSMMNQIFAVMILASAAMSLAVIFNITSINIYDRRRDIATLKVLGYQREEVEKIILIENLVLTAIGSVLGIALGLLMQYALVGIVSETDMYLPFIFIPLVVPISVILIFGFTFLANLLLKGKIKRINMVESLKSVE